MSSPALIWKSPKRHLLLAARQNHTMNCALPFDRESIAHHEAGHAVMAFLSGILAIDGPIHINGMLTERGNAETPLHEDPALLARRQAEGWVIDEFERRKQRAAVAAAGYAAEMLLAAKAGRVFDKRAAFKGAHGDVLTVQEVWGKGEFMRFAELVATVMQRPEVWAMVEQLATKLLATSGPLPAAQATALLEAAQRAMGVKVGLHLPELRSTPE